MMFSKLLIYSGALKQTVGFKFEVIWFFGEFLCFI